MTWLDFDGLVNARDIGGLPTEDGRTTRSGVLLRTDNLQALSPSDIDRLVDELGVRTVLDLRTDGELHLEGPGPLVARPEVQHKHLTLIPHDLDGRSARADDEADVDRAVPGPDAPEGDLSHFYVAYLLDAPDNLAEALRSVGSPGSGTVVAHCAIGKDRTGVVIALSLRLAGVTREAVVADYLLTGERIEAVRDRLLASDTYRDDTLPKTVESMRPRASSIERFLDEVDRRWGGPEGLGKALGLTDDELTALRSRLVG